MNDLPHIGTVELVDLPDAQVVGVPAKIDTGADSSAIWASDIVEQDGQLSFVLFGTASSSYTGRQLTVDKYMTTRVRNSFGVVERRYKVPLRVVLGGRTIKANFTLADRSSNRYPVLVGRKTIHNKFLVNVAIRPERGTCNILMLSTKRTDVTQRFADNIAASSKRLSVTYAAYEDLDYAAGQPGSLVTLRATGQDIAGFDLVYFKTTAKYMDVAASTARYLEKRKVPFIDEAIKHYPGTSKLYQYMLLEHSGLQVPRSLFRLPSGLAAEGAYEALVAAVGLPFVLKDIHGNKGEHNYVVTDEKSYAQACAMAAEDGVQCIAQAFIPNDCDYRVLVFGSRIGLVIKRMRRDDSTHLNNTSQGAHAEVVPPGILPRAVQSACLQVARLVERQIAGVDIVQDKVSGLWYCLEVNDGPQLATGSFTHEKYAALAGYLERKLA